MWSWKLSIGVAEMLPCRLGAIWNSRQSTVDARSLLLMSSSPCRSGFVYPYPFVYMTATRDARQIQSHVAAVIVTWVLRLIRISGFIELVCGRLCPQSPILEGRWMSKAADDHDPFIQDKEEMLAGGVKWARRPELVRCRNAKNAKTPAMVHNAQYRVKDITLLGYACEGVQGPLRDTLNKRRPVSHVLSTKKSREVAVPVPVFYMT